MKFLRVALLLLGLAALASRGAVAQQVNAQTGVTYTIANTDCDPSGARMLSFNNVAPVAVTLPQSGASALFYAGCRIQVQNQGLGVVTITPTTSTINSGTALVLNTGQSATIYPDGTPAATGNYWAHMGGASSGSPSSPVSRNLLDNGAMQIQQRGTGVQTCAANAGLIAANYSADRWGCQVNVGSGAGSMVAATTGGPTGILNVQTMYRTSGALTQPVCAMQAVPAAVIKSAAGLPVTFSFWAYALAGLSADNGNVINAYIFTGTTADQKLSTSPTATPAITPAWAGITSNITKQYTITTTPTRYSLTGTIPAAALEAAAVLCFTPTATGAGATDGFGFTGTQLELGTFPTPFEFHTFEYDQLVAEFYYTQFSENAGNTGTVIANCHNSSVTLANCYVQFPVPMRAAPTMTYANGFATETTAAGGTLGACTTLATASTVAATAPGIFGILVGCTAGTVPAAGTAGQLFSNGTTGLIKASADL